MPGIQYSVALRQPPALLQSPPDDLSPPRRSRLPDLGNETWVNVRVLGPQARLPAPRCRLIFVLRMHGACGIATSELEVVIRQHPVANLRLRARDDLGFLLTHETPF